MDITQNLSAIVIKTVSAMLSIEIIVGHLCTPMGIRSHFILGRIYIVPGFICICKIYRSAVVSTLF